MHRKAGKQSLKWTSLLNVKAHIWGLGNMATTQGSYGVLQHIIAYHSTISTWIFQSNTSVHLTIDLNINTHLEFPTQIHNNTDINGYNTQKRTYIHTLTSAKSQFILRKHLRLFRFRFQLQ